MSSAPPKILLVDDDAALCDALQFALELEGFVVETYASAEALSGRHDLPGEGCLVVDYRLPGIDGLALLRNLRRRDVRLPALLITSNPAASLQRQAARLGVPIVEKPLLGDALLSSIRSALDAHSREALSPQ